jgi:hypothetical protein
VDVLRHHHPREEAEAVSVAGFAQTLDELVTQARVVEERVAVIAGEREEVDAAIGKEPAGGFSGAFLTHGRGYTEIVPQAPSVL